MLEKCYSGAQNGVDARTAEVEVCSQGGTGQRDIDGLPDRFGAHLGQRGAALQGLAAFWGLPGENA